MPADFLEPEGKKGKWSEVVKNEKLGISYREKVIQLSKYRQEETGIKKIRRREVLTYPEGFYESGKKIDKRNYPSKYRFGSEFNEDLLSDFFNFSTILYSKQYFYPNSWIRSCIIKNFGIS